MQTCFDPDIKPKNKYETNIWHAALLSWFIRFYSDPPPLCWDRKRVFSGGHALLEFLSWWTNCRMIWDNWTPPLQATVDDNFEMRNSCRDALNSGISMVSWLHCEVARYRVQAVMSRSNDGDTLLCTKYSPPSAADLPRWGNCFWCLFAIALCAVPRDGHRRPNSGTAYCQRQTPTPPKVVSTRRSSGDALSSNR